MNLVKCENEHIYDKDKFVDCPHCSQIQVGQFFEETVETQGKVATATGVYEGKLKKRKTVGLLVCIKGKNVGDGYILREGSNLIGRAANMDVSLRYEVTVSRENHASINYDAKQNRFDITVLSEQNAVWCNEIPIKDSYELSDRMIVQVGECQLMFLAVCNSQFSWYDE